MGQSQSIFLILLTAFAGWLLYSRIRHRPELFSAESLQGASFTLGLLAIFLIALIGFFVVTM